MLPPKQHSSCLRWFRFGEVFKQHQHKLISYLQEKWMESLLMKQQSWEADAVGLLLESKTAEFIVDTSSEHFIHTQWTLATLLLGTFLLHALLFVAHTSPNSSSTEISQSLTFWPCATPKKTLEDQRSQMFPTSPVPVADLCKEGFQDRVSPIYWCQIYILPSQPFQPGITVSLEKNHWRF